MMVDGELGRWPDPQIITSRHLSRGIPQVWKPQSVDFMQLRLSICCWIYVVASSKSELVRPCRRSEKEHFDLIWFRLVMFRCFLSCFPLIWRAKGDAFYPFLIFWAWNRLIGISFHFVVAGVLFEDWSNGLRSNHKYCTLCAFSWVRVLRIWYSCRKQKGMSYVAVWFLRQHVVFAYFILDISQHSLWVCSSSWHITWIYKWNPRLLFNYMQPYELPSVKKM